MKEHIKNAYKFLLPRVLEITSNLPADHLGNLKELAATIETNCTSMLSAIESGKLPENIVVNDSMKELNAAHARISELENALKDANVDVQTLLDTNKTLNETINRNDLKTVSDKLDLILANDEKVDAAINTIEKHQVKTNETLTKISDRLIINK